MVHFVVLGEFYYSTSQVLTNDFDRYCHRFLFRVGDEGRQKQNRAFLEFQRLHECNTHS